MVQIIVIPLLMPAEQTVPYPDVVTESLMPEKLAMMAML
jgi:hypothetical protein